jgi:hypothetical protein
MEIVSFACIILVLIFASDYSLLDVVKPGSRRLQSIESNASAVVEENGVGRSVVPVKPTVQKKLFVPHPVAVNYALRGNSNSNREEVKGIWNRSRGRRQLQTAAEAAEEAAKAGIPLMKVVDGKTVEDTAEAHVHECNWTAYVDMYADLAALSPEQARGHYLAGGWKEKRVCDFDWEAYLLFNPDLVAAGVKTKEQSMGHFKCCGSLENRPYKFPPGFDWLAYLERNQDVYESVGYNDKYQAIRHYSLDGKREDRVFDPLVPTDEALALGLAALKKYLTATADSPFTRNLIVYNIDIMKDCEDCGLTTNNVKMFVACLFHQVAAEMKGTKKSGQQSAFYWFNIVNAGDNPLSALIPKDVSNIVLVDWYEVSSSFNTFVQTLSVIGAENYNQFGGLFHLGSGVRGPFAQWENGDWISEFRSLLDANNVGLVGPIMNCQNGSDPYVNIHAFAMRPAIAPLIFAAASARTVFTPLDFFFHSELSHIVLRNKYSIASIVHKRRANILSISADPATGSPQPMCPDLFKDDCAIDPMQAIFLRWHVDPLVTPKHSYICTKIVSMSPANTELVKGLTKLAIAAFPATTSISPTQRNVTWWREMLDPVFPELITVSQNGIMLLVREYRDSFTTVSPVPQLAPPQTLATDKENADVCFVVSVNAIDIQPLQKDELYDRNRLQDFVNCK